MVQLPLALPILEARGADDFMLAPSNQEAVRMLERWPDWPSPTLCVHGPKGCGKTHLATIMAAQRGGALLLPDLAAIDPLLSQPPRLTILDDAENFLGERRRETELFHLHNATREAGGHLLCFFSRPPAQLSFALPDLASRLRAAHAVSIAAPEDDLLAALLIKHFSDRQLRVPEEVIGYLLPRIERSGAAAAAMVAALDAAALSQKRAITVPLVRQVLEEGLGPANKSVTSLECETEINPLPAAKVHEG